MFSGVENCCRIPPTERAVEDRAYVGSGSTTHTSKPSEAGSEDKK